jgi:hypothetical protein
LDRGQVHRELVSISGGNEGGAALEIATHFVVGAFLGIMHWWLDHDTELTPAEVDAMFQRLAFKGVEAVIQRPN